MKTNSLASLLHAFFHEWMVNQKNLSHHTVCSYRDTWKLFLRFTSARKRKEIAELLFSGCAQLTASLNAARATGLRPKEFGRRQFVVNGEAYWAGHINYIGVGMVAAHTGQNTYQLLPALVFGHNVLQALAGTVRGDFGAARNFKDIIPGTKWALIGADFYRRRSIYPEEENK